MNLFNKADKNGITGKFNGKDDAGAGDRVAVRPSEQRG